MYGDCMPAPVPRHVIVHASDNLRGRLDGREAASFGVHQAATQCPRRRKRGDTEPKTYEA
jgi:hypothetical protein